MISRFDKIIVIDKPEPLSTCTTTCSNNSNEMNHILQNQTTSTVHSSQFPSLLHTYNLQIKVKQYDYTACKKFSVTVAQQSSIKFDILKSIILEKVKEKEKTYLTP